MTLKLSPPRQLSCADVRPVIRSNQGLIKWSRPDPDQGLNWCNTPLIAAQIVGFAGYSSYLTALSYAVYLQLGGVPAGQPGYDAGALPAGSQLTHVCARGGPLHSAANLSGAVLLLCACPGRRVLEACVRGGPVQSVWQSARGSVVVCTEAYARAASCCAGVLPPRKHTR